MNQGEIRVMTEDLLDWAFDKGERHGREVAAHQEAIRDERERTANMKQRADLTQYELDAANTRLREVQSA